MTDVVRGLTLREEVNFLLTNRIPRRLATQFVGWYSQIESEWLAKVTVAVWQLFVDDLKLSEAKKSRYNSLQECFIRQLKDGARQVDNRAEIVTSPCDAIVGACGRIEDGRVYQAKGFPYAISELIPEQTISSQFESGTFVTLRLKSSMYHRFHAPVDCEVEQLTYISGDTWNVNPVALKKVEQLFCQNERAVVPLKLSDESKQIVLVPVAAILVASMRFHCLGDVDVRQGANKHSCSASYNKGDEMGYFQHGSTIIMFCSDNYQLCDGVELGQRINMGQALLIDKPH